MNSHEDLTSMYAKLVGNLNCAICQDTLKDARDLSCGHTYCLACLVELVTIKGWTSIIQCCLCQKQTTIPSAGLSGLKQNYKLNCIIDEQATIMKKMKAPRHQQGTTGATKTLQIWVIDLEGKSQSIQVQLSDTADALKRQVAKKTGIPPNVQRLYYEGKQLEGKKTLKEYGVHVDSNIHLGLPLKGGEGTQ